MNMNNSLEQLTQRFRGDFPKKQAEIVALSERLKQANSDSTAIIQDIRDTVHYVKGAFGMYGFQGLYDRCEALQRAVEGNESKSQLLEHLQSLIEELDEQSP